MPKKKITVVELNKPEEKIVLEEITKPPVTFLRKYGKYLLLIILMFLLISGFIFFKYVTESKNPQIKEVTIDDTLDEYNATVGTNLSPLTDEEAKNNFNKNHLFSSNGEVLLVKKVESSEYVIRYFSDGTALKILKKRNIITRISALEDGSYAIDQSGVINTKAKVSDITIKEIKDYPYGTVTYYSDGSAELSNSKMDLYIRNSKDVLDNYISNNKVTYLKETKNINSIIINYYYDDTIEVIKDNKNYLLRNSRDLEITETDVFFSNNNQSTIINTVTLDDGNIIDYYQDGGAIIRNGTKTISVRKSNSIQIKNNKIYEIVDNIYVTISNKLNNEDIVYYTNGSAVIKYQGKTLYIEENSNILYQNGNISEIDGSSEDLVDTRTTTKEEISLFEQTAVIKTSDYIAIVPKESIIFDKDGTLKEITINKESDIPNDFKITNNTDTSIKYRIVIEESSKTTLDTSYVKYQLSAGSKYLEPTFLKQTLWTKDNLSKSLSIKGTNYILYDGTLEANSEESIKIMFWTDYETIPNTMQDKYFYGTIKVYAWIEE